MKSTTHLCTMGKKMKGGRRQILQLEEKKPVKVPSKSKLKSLIQHYSDSDDDSKKSNDSEFSASATTVNADATPLESQIADFFKEIDALSVPEELLEETGKPASLCKTKTLKQDIPDACGSESIVDSPPLESKESCHSDGQNEEAYCSWQEICDDSTGYSYYWNVQTNEVTWDCPAEYETYMKTVYAASKDKVSQVAEDDQNIEAKSKKMKNDNMLVPEGAIVPISYFGKSSSSDDSSDCESGSLKSKKKPTPSKLSPVKKIKPAKEGEPKCKSNDEESASEVIGPQLPPNFQFPQTVPVEHKNYTDVLVPVKEVEDFVEVDSLFSLKASNDMTEKPSQSDQNKFPVESSNLEISLESSLKAIENKFLQIHEGTIDESPDSTVKKGENVTRHREPTNYQASNSTYGFRPVVEYDNFTDEDEDICVSNISSSNQFINDKSEFESPTLQEQDSIGESLNSMKTTVEAANEMKSSKRKVTESLKESSNKEELIKRSKHSDVDIDSLFAAHTSYGKYGFGLGWQKQRQPENKELCSTSTRDYKAPKSHSDFKAVNFIKSNDILDLKALYDDAINDERNPVCLHASVQSNIECEKQIEENALYSKYRFGLGWQKQRQPENEELCSTSTRDYKAAKNHSDFNAVNFIKSNDILDLKALCDDAISDERNPVCLHESVRSNIECEEQIEEKSVKQKCEIVEDPIIIDVKITDNTADSSNNILLLRDKHGSFIVNKRKKDGQLGKFSCRTSLIVEEDLDEIDKALCDALDEKKGTENSSTKSLSPSSALENSSKSALESALSAVCPEKNTDADGSDAEITDGTDIVDDILQVSSALIDKLTVLLSTHSTLASLSGYFFQLQTRFVDWQAGALDSNYFMARLKEVEQYIQHYERSVVSGEWTCQWDRINKRYFYMNNRTQHSQWTYPEEPCTQEKSSWVQEHAGLSVSSFLGKREDLPAVSSSVTESQRHPGESLDSEPKGTSNDSTIAQWILHSSPPPPPPGVDSPPPPPPPQTPPPDSPPPPPPDSTEMEREPEDMDIENSNDSTSFLFAHNKSIPDDGRMQYISMMEQSPVINASIFSAVSSTSVSSCEDINVISKLSKSVSHSFDSSDVNNMHWSQPSCISQVIFKPAIESSVLASKNTDVQTTEDKCSEFCASSSNEICSSQSDALQIKTSKPGSIALKKEKKKSKILPGLGLKKKNIPSLVEKWQKIKEQQNNDDSDDSKSSNLL